MDGNALEPTEQDARVPPHDLDCEAAVLSALFLDPSLTVEIEPHHFYSDANALIYEAIRAAGADIALVAHYLRDAGKLGRVGGQPYLAMIVDATPAVANVQAHAAIVRECWRRRFLIAALQTVTAELYHGLGADEAWGRVKEACST